MKIRNNIIKLAWENPLQRRAFLDVLAEIDKEAKPGQDTIVISGWGGWNTPVGGFKLQSRKSEWEADAVGLNNNNIFKLLSMLEHFLQALSNGETLKNTTGMLSAFKSQIQKIKKLLNNDDAGALQKWRNLIDVYMQIIDHIIALKDSGADNYKQESVKEECKLLYKAFHDHVGKLGSRIHNDPKLGEDE